MKRIPLDEQRRLIALVQQGDGGAFEKLLDGFDSMLWNRARRFARGDEHADELHQLALIEFYKAVMNFDESRGLQLITPAWEYIDNRIKTTIAHERGPNALTQKRRGKHVSLDGGVIDGRSVHDIVFDPNAHDPAEILAESADVQADFELVYEAVDRLAEPERELIRLRLQEKTLDEMAEVYGLTRERMRQKLNAAMEEFTAIITDPRLPDFIDRRKAGSSRPVLVPAQSLPRAKRVRKPAKNKWIRRRQKARDSGRCAVCGKASGEFYYCHGCREKRKRYPSSRGSKREELTIAA